jgi:hypothetical protein
MEQMKQLSETLSALIYDLSILEVNLISETHGKQFPKGQDGPIRALENLSNARLQLGIAKHKLG